jgi:hypothetical protein
MDPHAPDAREASDGDAMRGTLLHAASSDVLVFAACGRLHCADAHRRARIDARTFPKLTASRLPGVLSTTRSTHP